MRIVLERPSNVPNRPPRANGRFYHDAMKRARFARDGNGLSFTLFTRKTPRQIVARWGTATVGGRSHAKPVLGPRILYCAYE